MSSTPGNLKTTLAGRARRTTSRRRLGAPRGSCRARRSSNNGGGRRSCSRKCSNVVSAKLETLKSLIPSHSGKTKTTSSSATVVKPDQLFQETADYIVLLRTQVLILQRLVEFYGSSDNENVAAVS